MASTIDTTQYSEQKPYDGDTAETSADMMVATSIASFKRGADIHQWILPTV